MSGIFFYRKKNGYGSLFMDFPDWFEFAFDPSPESDDQ